MEMMGLNPFLGPIKRDSREIFGDVQMAIPIPIREIFGRHKNRSKGTLAKQRVVQRRVSLGSKHGLLADISKPATVSLGWDRQVVYPSTSPGFRIVKPGNTLQADNGFRVNMPQQLP